MDGGRGHDDGRRLPGAPPPHSSPFWGDKCSAPKGIFGGGSGGGWTEARRPISHMEQEELV